MTITFSIWSLILLGIFVVLPALFVYVISIGMAISDLWLSFKQKRERERQRREFNLHLSRKR